MTTIKRDLNTDGTVAPVSFNKRIYPTEQLQYKFASVDTEVDLEICTPVGVDNTTGYAGIWLAPDPTVAVVTSGTGGTWGLTFNGFVLANTTFAWNATAALVQATLKAYNIDATVALDTSVYTITFDGAEDVETLPTVTADVTQLTGGDPGAVITAGAATNGRHVVRGFVYPYEITQLTTGEITEMVMTKGRISYFDIKDTVDSGDVTALATALKAGLVSAGIEVTDLVSRI